MSHKSMGDHWFGTSDVHNSISDYEHTMRYPDSAVAVIGVACKFAGANSVEELWQVLKDGKSQCIDLPQDRFPPSRFERRTGTTRFKANIIDDVDTFDHKFFGISSREAAFMDPQQRLALQVTYQALESAGHFSTDSNEATRDMGCFFATCMTDYYENVVTHAPSAFSLTGTARPFIAGKVSHHFGLTGPSIMLDAACAASGVAVNVACRAVASGECSSAIAGATNILTRPESFQDLAGGRFTSTTGASKSFDEAADGYARGEGVAVIVLKKLSEALKDGDVIKAVISATAVNQCAREAPIVIPHGPSQISLFRKALKLAGLQAHDISYVEAHGTGTRVGDPIEVDSIRAVFGDLSREDDDKTYMGSLKSNIGHVEATAGLSGLIKVIMMIEKRTIPQQALFNRLNSNISPIEPYGIEISKSNIPWTSKYRAACVNNFGASGTNTVMVVTQPPASSGNEFAACLSSVPISITAFSASSLKLYCSALLDFIEASQENEYSVSDISYHLSRKQNPELPFSIAASVSTMQELKDFLVTATNTEPHKADLSKRPVVMFFGGQNGKTANVPKSLYDSCTIFRKHLDYCEATLLEIGGPSIYPAIFDCNMPVNSMIGQLALFCGQYASALSWLNCGIKPARLIGHSFGQLTALCVSEILSLRDALQFVTNRAILIDKQWPGDPGSMIAIEATREQLSNLLERHAGLNLEIACYNGTENFVLAGRTSSIETLEASLRSSSEICRYKKLEISHGFHSALAEPLVEPLLKIAEELNFQEPKYPVETCSENGSWSSITPSLIAAHIRKPVHFQQAVDRISRDLGSCTWIEAGAGTSVAMLRKSLDTQKSAHDVMHLKFNSPNPLLSLAKMTTELWQSGCKVQFWPFQHHQQSQYRTLNLPPYQFDKSHHWLEWQELELPVAEIRQSPQVTSPIKLVRKSKDHAEFEVNMQNKGWLAICSDHLVLDFSTYPISLLLDLVSKAIDTLQSDMIKQETLFYKIQSLRTPISTTAQVNGLPLCLRVEKYSSSPLVWNFKYTSSFNEHYQFMSGQLLACTAEESRLPSNFARLERLMNVEYIQSLMGDSESDSLRGKSVYQSVANMYRFPKASHSIREISAKGNEVAASLTSLPKDIFNAVETLITIPLIYLNGLQECHPDDMFLNTTVGNVEFHNQFSCSSGKNGPWLAYLRFFEVGTSEVACDMYVFDKESGRLSSVLLDIGFAQIAMRTLEQTLGGSSRTLSRSTTDNSSDTFSSEATIARVTHNPALCDNGDDKEIIEAHGLPDLEEAISRLLVRVADVDIDMICGGTELADLGIDSLMGMEVIDEINKEFHVNIDVEEFITVTDIGSLCQLIATRTNATLSNSGNISGAVSTEFKSQVASSNIDHSGSETRFALSMSRPRCEEATPALLNEAVKAFEQIRGDFDTFAQETGCDKYCSQVYPAHTRLVVAYIIEGFAKLGCTILSLKLGDRVPDIPHLPKYDRLVTQLMCILQDVGIVSQSGKDWIRAKEHFPVEIQSTDQLNIIKSRYPQFSTDHELLRIAGSNLAECLNGTQNPLKLLFGSPEKRKLMADQYTVSPIQFSVSRQLVAFIKKCFGSRAAKGSLRVLEVGGGTCGTTIHALEAFAELGIPVEYTFTDISSSFIASAKTKLKKYDFVRYRTLDITARPPSELLGAFHMVIATNVVHATPNTCISVGNIRQMLQPDGFLTMVEHTRLNNCCDLIFGLLDGWWLFEDDRDHALMDEKKWEATLKRAGYENVDWTGSPTQESNIVKILLAY